MSVYDSVHDGDTIGMMMIKTTTAAFSQKINNYRKRKKAIFL